jgi:dihydrolipoamide dehydrogenase
LIEKENLGGTCLNWGCIPSKIMKNSSDLFIKTKNVSQFGVSIDGDINFDINSLMEKKEKIIQTQRKGIEDLLIKSGVNLLKGKGYIKDNDLIQVDLIDGGIEKVTYDNLILATGTKPLNMKAFPFDHKKNPIKRRFFNDRPYPRVYNNSWRRGNRLRVCVYSYRIRNQSYNN